MTDTICNFFPEHIDYLNAPESSKQGILTNYGLKNFVFMSIIKSEKLLGVLGCRFLNNNTCELYAIPDVVHSKKYNKTFHKLIHSCFNFRIFVNNKKLCLMNHSNINFKFFIISYRY